MRISQNSIFPRAGMPFFLLLLVSCHLGHRKNMDRRITLWHKDKIPYGNYIAYEGLPFIFPNADISINRNSPSEWHGVQQAKAYIIIAARVHPDGSEVTALLNFAGEGNQVFISAFSFGDSLLHALNIKQAHDPGSDDSLRLSVYSPVTGDSLSFAYPGFSFDDRVSRLDSQYVSVLGRDAKGRPDLVRVSYKGGGAIYLHFAPLAFSNFFLLHKQNKAYYENVFSYLPVSVREVLWDEYYRYDRAKPFSAFQYILNNRALRWAFWLTLLLFGLIYLFGSKRKQRIVPLMPGLNNNSLDFVKTIGRLYYQRRDNHNLAMKMAAHFQDYIRGRYNIPAFAPDEGFVHRLSYKTGVPKEFLQELLTVIKYSQDNEALSDGDLLILHRQLEEFYKQV